MVAAADDQGFDFVRSSRESRSVMKPSQLTEFATDTPGDPYRLDENGYPFDQTDEDALSFMRENKDKPFFLYYATWLVHMPIHTQAKEHLEKYARKWGLGTLSSINIITSRQSENILF